MTPFYMMIIISLCYIQDKVKEMLQNTLSCSSSLLELNRSTCHVLTTAISGRGDV